MTEKQVLPYGDQSEVKGITKEEIAALRKLQIEEIGNNVRIIQKDSKKTFSEEIASYESFFFVRNRPINKFWVSRAGRRFSRGKKYEYAISREEFTKTLKETSAQIIDIPPALEKRITSLLGKEVSKMEDFLMEEVFTKSLALDAALERTFQVAKKISDDDDISFDTTKLKNLHSDSLLLMMASKLIESAGLPKEIRDFYLERMIEARFSTPKAANVTIK